MELPQARLLRRRRRWLIVAVILVLVSLISWWHWPRGDARFVGKWERKDVGTGTKWEIVLCRNGTGWADTAGDMGTRFAWRVEGDRLTLGTDTVIGRSRFAYVVARPLAWITGRAWLLGLMAHEIIQVSENQLRLKRRDRVNEVIWNRIPE